MKKLESKKLEFVYERISLFNELLISFQSKDKKIVFEDFDINKLLNEGHDNKNMLKIYKERYYRLLKYYKKCQKTIENLELIINKYNEGVN